MRRKFFAAAWLVVAAVIPVVGGGEPLPLAQAGPASTTAHARHTEIVLTAHRMASAAAAASEHAALASCPDSGRLYESARMLMIQHNDYVARANATHSGLGLYPSSVPVSACSPG